PPRRAAPGPKRWSRQPRPMRRGPRSGPIGQCAACAGSSPPVPSPLSQRSGPAGPLAGLRRRCVLVDPAVVVRIGVLIAIAAEVGLLGIETAEDAADDIGAAGLEPVDGAQGRAATNH